MALSEYFFGALEALAQYHPEAAAAVAGITSVLQSRFNRKSELTTNALRERLSELKDRLDADQIPLNEEQVAEIAHNCMVVMMRSQQREKLRAAANILWNTCLKTTDPEKRPLNELDHFARCLETLSLDALHVLREAVKVKKHTELTGNLLARTLSIPEQLVVGLLRQLESCDFVLLHFSLGTVGSQHQYSVHIRPAAKDFVKYVLDAGSDA